MSRLQVLSLSKAVKLAPIETIMADTKHQSLDELYEPGVDEQANNISPGEIIIGTIDSIDHEGRVLVDFSENIGEKPIPAISTIAVTHQQCGHQVALLFANGNLNSPVVIGVIHNPLNEMLENFELSPEAGADSTENQEQLIKSTSLDKDDVLIDGKRLVIEGEQEIVLKCGESSITLTKSGKILIRGKYLLNRSTGVNRIMGGSVQVN